MGLTDTRTAVPRRPSLRDTARRLRRLALHPVMRTIAAVGAVLLGASMVLLATAVGHCSFAGGRCPAPPVPWWQDDAFGTAAVGLVLLVTAPVLARRPSRRGLRQATVGALATLPLAWLLAEALRTGSW